MNSLRDTIAFNSGVKKRQQMINENVDSSKKEMIVMRRVLDIVTNFVSQVEDLKLELNSPTAGRYYAIGANVPNAEPTISPEEMVSIKKKAYELFLSKMKVADEVIHSTFGIKHEEKEEEKAEEKEEDGEEW